MIYSIVENFNQRNKKAIEALETTKNIVNDLTKKINSLISPNDELLSYLNKELVINNISNKTVINTHFNNQIKILENKIQNDIEQYNWDNVTKAINLRNKMANRINNNFMQDSIETAINTKNEIFEEILDDLEYQEKEFNIVKFDGKEFNIKIPMK